MECVIVGATTVGLLVPGDIVRITAIMAVSLAIANGLQVWLAYRRRASRSRRGCRARSRRS